MLGGRAAPVLGAFALAAGALGGFAGSASAAGTVSCTTYPGIPVALAAGDPASYSVSGELCATPSELTNGNTVQLLIHGATYHDTYWDFGTVDGVSYSYARDLAAAGYPTFAYDGVGTAETTPLVPSSDVTLDGTAYVAHEMVQDLLAGAIGGTKFGKVIDVGHSLGSGISWAEAATYHDVAGVVITGGVHAVAESAVSLAGDFSPAIDDPAFANSGLDSGYLTTVPGTREALFYNAADSDPNVIAADEATKDVVSGTVFSQSASLAQSTVSQQINVPVLAIIGSEDRLFCGPEINGATFSCSSGQEVASEEAPWYSAAAQLRACVIPGSGHSINLALNHDLEEADVVAWSYEYVGTLGVPPLSARVLPPDCSSS
jgi:pimeloyl-ACP methyl ester carboxylesterase